MSVRRISAVLCTALALTFAGGSAALAHATDSPSHSSTTDDSCPTGDPTVMRGTSGNDMLDARTDSRITTICGFGGDDTIIANNNGDKIYGGPGNDIIYGGPGIDYIEGQGGDDTILDCTPNLTDCKSITPGYTYTGGGAADTILGQTGNDTINSKDGAPDTLVDGGTGHNNCIFDDRVSDNVKNC
jgi:Ca2+-binding RTX toxin-like protein